MPQSPTATTDRIEHLVDEVPGGRLRVRVLSERLAERRAALGHSQAGICALTGVAACSVSMYESGHRDPRASSLVRLAAVLETSVSYLVGETDDPTPCAPAPHVLSPHDPFR